jgi:hypothetical protein
MWSGTAGGGNGRTKWAKTNEWPELTHQLPLLEEVEFAIPSEREKQTGVNHQHANFWPRFFAST